MSLTLQDPRNTRVPETVRGRNVQKMATIADTFTSRYTAVYSSIQLYSGIQQYTGIGRYTAVYRQQAGETNSKIRQFTANRAGTIHTPLIYKDHNSDSVFMSHCSAVIIAFVEQTSR